MDYFGRGQGRDAEDRNQESEDVQENIIFDTMRSIQITVTAERKQDKLKGDLVPVKKH